MDKKSSSAFSHCCCLPRASMSFTYRSGEWYNPALCMLSAISTAWSNLPFLSHEDINELHAASHVSPPARHSTKCTGSSQQPFWGPCLLLL